MEVNFCCLNKTLCHQGHETTWTSNTHTHSLQNSLADIPGYLCDIKFHGA